jgi:transposase
MSSHEAIPRASTGASQRIEIITGHERRRRFTDVDKARLVSEAAQPGESVAIVARRHGICSSLLYRWRRAGLGLQPLRLASPLLAVHVAEQERAERGTAASVRCERLVEITLPNGCSVRVDPHIESRALRRILAALRG